MTDDDYDADLNLRSIKCVDLAGGDVSICATGANDLASVSVRAADLGTVSILWPNASQRARERLVLAEARQRARARFESFVPPPRGHAYYRDRLELLHRA